MATVNPRLQKIKSWLKENKMIKPGAICDKIGLQQSNFSAALSGTRSIPEKYISAFENELKKYGYKKGA